MKEQVELLNTFELPKQKTVPVPMEKLKRFLFVEGKGQAVKKSDDSKRVSEIRSKLSEKQKVDRKMRTLRNESMQQAKEIKEKLKVKRKNTDLRNLSELSKCLLIHEMQSSVRDKCSHRYIPRSEKDRKPLRQLNNAEFKQVFKRRRSQAHASVEEKGCENTLSYKKSEHKEESKSNDCSRKDSELVSDNNCESENIQGEVIKYGEEFKEELKKEITNSKKAASEIENIEQATQELEASRQFKRSFTLGLDHPNTLPLISDADESPEKEETPKKEEVPDKEPSPEKEPTPEIEPMPELKLDDARRDLTEHINVIRK